MQQVQLPLDVNGNAHVAYVQSRSIGGQGDDVSVLDPRQSVRFQFVFGQIVYLFAAQAFSYFAIWATFSGEFFNDL